MASRSKTKVCSVCKKIYTPKQYATQIYCGRQCKNKARYLKATLAGKPTKGGYSRSTYIRVWMKARNNAGFKDKTPYVAPCTYCGKQMKVDDNFNLAHTVPRSSLTFEQIKSEEFLALSCPDCNQAMGTMTVQEFTGEE